MIHPQSTLDQSIQFMTTQNKKLNNKGKKLIIGNDHVKRLSDCGH